MGVDISNPGGCGDGEGRPLSPRLLHVGLVGAGYWGPNWLRTLSNVDGCRIAGVCELSAGRLQYLAERFPDVPRTADYAALLSQPELDAVVIATPPATHRQLAETALRAGKHVLVEKPLATNSRDAQDLVELADREGLVLGAGHIFVYHPAVAELRRAVDSGELGELCYAETQRINLGPPASQLDVIWDLAVHDISILQSILGRSPVEVVTEGRRYVHPSLADVAFLTLRYADGFLAVLHVSWRSALKARRFLLAGTTGSAVFDDTVAEAKLILADAGIDTRIGARDTDVKDLEYGPGEVRAPLLSTVAPLTAECEDFLECIRSGTSPLADGRAGLEVVRVLEAAEESLRTGEPVRLAPVPASDRSSESLSAHGR